MTSEEPKLMKNSPKMTENGPEEPETRTVLPTKITKCDIEMMRGKNKGLRCCDVHKYCTNARHAAYRDREGITLIRPGQLARIKSGPNVPKELLPKKAKEQAPIDLEDAVNAFTKKVPGSLPPPDLEEIKFEDVFKPTNSEDPIMDPNLNTGMTYCCLGSSKSGKTTLMINIWKKLKTKAKRGNKFINILYSNSLNAKIYAPMKRDKWTVCVPDYLPKMVKLQHRIQRHTNNHYRFFNLFDDIIDRKDDNLLRKMFMVLRNSNISTGICLHDPVLLASGNRGNINYLFMLKLNNAELVEKVVRRYLTPFLPGSMDQKIKTYQMLTKKRGVLLLDLLNNCLYHFYAKK
jgi:hypothetical protein